MDKLIQFFWALALFCLMVVIFTTTIIDSKSDEMMEKITKGQAIYKDDAEYRCKRVKE